MRYLLIGIVRVYQWTLGPLLRFFNGGQGMCRHQPTCSRYAIEALQRHGAWRGSWLTLSRLLRCQPWGTAGFDPVPPVAQPALPSAPKKDCDHSESSSCKDQSGLQQ